MRYLEFKTLLEYDRSKTVAALGPAIQKRAASDAYLKSKGTDPVDAVIAQAEEADPTANKQYVVWIVQQYVKRSLKYEDMYKLRDDLDVFVKTKGQHKRLGINSDINQYDWKTLATVAEKLSSTNIADTDTAEVSAIPDVKVLYNGPLGILSVPETEAASCELGRGTKWCTASSDPARNMFNHYTKDGLLYVWHDKKLKEKFQFHFESGQFMDARDEPIDGGYMHYFTSENPVTSKLFTKKAPLVLETYVDYLEREPEQDDDGYHLPLNDEGSEILDANINMLINSVPIESLKKLIKTAAYYSNEDTDRFALADALIKRFQKHPDVLEQALTNRHFESTYRDYKLKRAPREETIEYLNQNPTQWSASYAVSLAKREKARIPELEPLIAKDGRKAYDYAYHVLNQERWPEAESSIAKDSWAALYYAKNILKRRWPEAETVIQEIPSFWKHYQELFPEASST